MRLNNRGIVYLEAEMHHHAAAYFKKASKLLITPGGHAETSDITDSKPQAVASPDPHCDSHLLPSEATNKCSVASPRLDGEKHLDTQQSTPNKRHTSLLSQTRKRHRPVTEHSNKAVEKPPQFVIGRPFWLTEGNRFKASMVSLSSILLYNLGLNYHLQALVDPKTGKSYLKRAMGIYEMAQKLAWKSPGPVLLLALHNMSQIHRYRGNHAQAILMSRELSKILRVLHVGIDGYEKFYIRMLSLQSRNLAPAA